MATEQSEGVDPWPLVVACLRFTDLLPEVDPLSGAVRRDVRVAGFSPADLAALEHALRVAQAWSGRALAVCAGPPAADAALREVAALGVQVLRVDRHGSDPHAGRAHSGGTHSGAVPGRLPSRGLAEPLGSSHDYLHDLVSDE
nr:hypothetical protein [Micromonospora sp. DSM 115978]